MEVDAVVTANLPIRDFWIEVPQAPPGRPRLFGVGNGSQGSPPVVIISEDEAAPSDEDEISDLDDLQLQEIVGEYTWPDGKTYLYARLRNEDIRKVCLAVFSERNNED